MVKEEIDLKEFYKVATFLEHSHDDLEKGEELVSYLTLSTVELVMKTMSRATKIQRINRQKTFFNPVIEARRRLGQGMHDRGEAIVFADGAEMSPDDLQGLRNHLPTHLKAISVKTKRIKKGEIWDVSVRGDHWGLDFMEELYCIVNVGHLILEPGAAVVNRGNVFSLVCQKITKMSGDEKESDSQFDIGILPTPFSVDYGEGPHDGPDGKNGAHGKDGKDGKTFQMTSSILGRLYMGEFEQEELDGKEGTSGGNGTVGTKGRNGGACKVAEITLRQIEGNLKVFAQAGAGGNGGNGGQGGDGGNGGNGSKGFRALPEIATGGNGGNGGNGGQGGRGGHAGNGGIASNIYINVPAGEEYKIQRTSLDSLGGKAGEGGIGGKSGIGGKAGKNHDDTMSAEGGKNGRGGENGRNGKSGRSRPAPWMFLNEII